MDEAERQRFLNVLREDDAFRDAVRRELLTDALIHLPETVAVLVDLTAQLRGDFTVLTQSVANYMQQTIDAVREGFAAVRTDIADLRTEMGARFTAVDAKFDQMDAEIRDIKDQLAS